MPKYYFDTFDGDNTTVDDTGLELPAESDVRDEAIKALPNLAAEMLPDGPQRSFWVKVRDEAGGVVFTASLEFTSSWGASD